MVKILTSTVPRVLGYGRIVFFFSVMVCGAQAVVVFPPETNPANGHLYYLVTGTVSTENPTGGLSWSEANLLAQNFAVGDDVSHLLSITTMQEEIWIKNTFADPGFDLTSHLNLFWTALTDRVNEGQYVWESGEPASNLNWSGGSIPPDSTGFEDFVYFTNTELFEPFTLRGQLNNHQDLRSLSGGQIPFSAMIEVTPLPEPSVPMMAALGVLGVWWRRRSVN